MADVPQDSFDEDLEGTPEEPLEGGEPEPKETVPEPKGKEPVAWEHFERVYQDQQRLAAEVDRQQQLLWQQGQTMQQAWQQRQAPPEPEDPQLVEVEKIITPIIDKRYGPMVQQFQQMKMVMEAQSEATAALQFFESHVPYHKEIQEDFIKYLNEEMDPVDKRRVFEDPRFAVQTAKLVKALKDSGQLKTTAQAKEAIRGRAKSESGGNSPSLNSQQVIDYNDMSDEDFAKMDAQIARRRGR